MQIFQLNIILVSFLCAFQFVEVHGNSEGIIQMLNDDINDFYEHYEQRFKELKHFINTNSTTANDWDIKYLLFTPSNPKVPYNLQRTKDSLEKSGFDSSLDTKIFIHGFFFPLEYPNDVKFETKDELFQVGEFNVIIVNYTQYAQGLLTEAARNGYIVAQNIANTMQFLMDNINITPNMFHLIGHSMGGHVAGNVGTLIKNIRRITGLDPSGPIYDILPIKYRLSYQSAKFVDIIHTNAARSFSGGVGIHYTIGHQDFYPNNGSKQPGCDMGDTYTTQNLEKKEISTLFDVLACNHQRSEFLFLESVANCNFIGVACPSYNDFSAGKCSNDKFQVAEMGHYAMKKPGMPVKSRFYLKTGSKPPYCK